MLQERVTRRFAVFASLILAATLCLFGFAACGSDANSGANKEAQSEQSQAEQPTTQTITDMVGRTVEVPAKADRIIGIGASSLRFISYLQATDKVVGVEQSEQEDSVTCSYRHVYHNVFKDLPVIGEGGSKGTTPNEEAIIQVKPEVIFASIDKDMADSLQEKTDIPVVCLTLPDLVFDQVFYDNVELMGSIIDREDRAAEIVKYMKDTQQDFRKRTASISDANTKTGYAAGISYRGGHGFAGTEAGFPPFAETNVTNIADVNGASGCFDIDLEEVASAQPDFIFVESGNISLVKEDYDSNPDYFASLNAVKDGSVYSLIAYRFYATNIELALANCYQVGAVVYPDQFSDVDPTKKLDEITEFFLGKKLSSDLAAEDCEFKQLDIAAL